MIYHFTVAALKGMVNAWWASHEKGYLKSLEVNGYGSPLPVEDGDWLCTHLTCFTWEGVLFS